DKLFTEIFSGRTAVPKTLIFAKDDSHADDIVKIVREEFSKGNDFCQKITYRTTGASPKELIQRFRNSPNPRVAVTVDMLATGTRQLELLSSLAGRLIRLEKRIEPDVRAEVEKLSGGKTVSNIARDLLDAIDPDKIEAQAGRDAPPGHPLEQSDLQSASEK